jgi:hypothetical protein
MPERGAECTGQLHSVESASEFLPVWPRHHQGLVYPRSVNAGEIGLLTRIRESEMLALIKLEEKGQTK